MIAGRLAAEVLEMIEEYVKPGISTGELIVFATDILWKNKSHPGSIKLQCFPKSICTSVNHVICHGLLDDQNSSKSGDIINIDITVIKNDFMATPAKCFLQAYSRTCKTVSSNHSRVPLQSD